MRDHLHHKRALALTLSAGPRVDSRELTVGAIDSTLQTHTASIQLAIAAPLLAVEETQRAEDPETTPEASAHKTCSALFHDLAAIARGYQCNFNEVQLATIRARLAQVLQTPEFHQADYSLATLSADVFRERFRLVAPFIFATPESSLLLGRALLLPICFQSFSPDQSNQMQQVANDLMRQIPNDNARRNLRAMLAESIIFGYMGEIQSPWINEYRLAVDLGATRIASLPHTITQSLIVLREEITSLSPIPTALWNILSPYLQQQLSLCSSPLLIPRNNSSLPPKELLATITISEVIDWIDSTVAKISADYQELLEQSTSTTGTNSHPRDAFEARFKQLNAKLTDTLTFASGLCRDREIGGGNSADPYATQSQVTLEKCMRSVFSNLMDCYLHCIVAPPFPRDLVYAFTKLQGQFAIYLDGGQSGKRLQNKLLRGIALVLQGFDFQSADIISLLFPIQETSVVECEYRPSRVVIDDFLAKPEHQAAIAHQLAHLCGKIQEKVRKVDPGGSFPPDLDAHLEQLALGMSEHFLSHGTLDRTFPEIAKPLQLLIRDLISADWRATDHYYSMRQFAEDRSLVPHLFQGTTRAAKLFGSLVRRSSAAAVRASQIKNCSSILNDALIGAPALIPILNNFMAQANARFERAYASLRQGSKNVTISDFDTDFEQLILAERLYTLASALQGHLVNPFSTWIDDLNPVTVGLELYKLGSDLKLPPFGAHSTRVTNLSYLQAGARSRFPMAAEMAFPGKLLTLYHHIVKGRSSALDLSSMPFLLAAHEYARMQLPDLETEPTKWARNATSLRAARRLIAELLLPYTLDLGRIPTKELTSFNHTMIEVFNTPLFGWVFGSQLMNQLCARLRMSTSEILGSGDPVSVRHVREAPAFKQLWKAIAFE